MTRPYESKRINDPVHRLIGVSELEWRIIDTATFQRLRRVKQLGLADLVYPSAGRTRFSHSIGACHVAGRILDTLQENGASISPEQYQIHRLAALLHDVGHYPFSHATEHAIRDHYSGTLVRRRDESSEAQPGEPRTPLSHEGAGKLLISRDPQIQRILADRGVAMSAVRQNRPGVVRSKPAT